jgi:hypothetical protein
MCLRKRQILARYNGPLPWMHSECVRPIVGGETRYDGRIVKEWSVL